MLAPLQTLSSTGRNNKDEQNAFFYISVAEFVSFYCEVHPKYINYQEL
jgi:hypothetical protein